MTRLTQVAFASSVTETQTDTRTFSAVAVTYDEITADARDPKVRFAAGCFGDKAIQGELPLVPLYVEHEQGKTRVGRIESWLDSDAALTFTASINTTEDGEAVYQALKAGDYAAVSVGVTPVDISEVEDGVVTFNYVELDHVAIVETPAFSGSTVLSVFSGEIEATAASETPNENSKENIMDNENLEVAELREDVQALTASFAAFRDDSAADSTPTTPFTSFGEYVKSFAAQSPEAIEFAKKVQGFAANGTSEDSVLRNGWTGDLIRLIEAPRKTINAFSSSPLPSEGMNVETAVLDTNSLQVEIQAEEFDEIVKGNISVSSVFEPIKTFAGGADVSRQAVERASVSYLELHWRGMAIEYAKRTEAYVRTKYLGAAAHAVSGVSFSDPDSITGFMFDAGAHLEDQGLTADVIVLTRDRAKALATLRNEEGDYFLNRSAGSVNILTASGDIAGVPFVVVPGTNHFSVASSQALRTWESGAPFRLQDEDVDTLSKTLAVYGYLAAHVQIPNAIVKAS